MADMDRPPGEDFNRYVSLMIEETLADQRRRERHQRVKGELGAVAREALLNALGTVLGNWRIEPRQRPQTLRPGVLRLALQRSYESRGFAPTRPQRPTPQRAERQRGPREWP